MCHIWHPIMGVTALFLIDLITNAILYFINFMFVILCIIYNKCYYSQSNYSIKSNCYSKPQTQCLSKVWGLLWLN